MNAHVSIDSRQSKPRIKFEPGVVRAIRNNINPSESYIDSLKFELESSISEISLDEVSNFFFMSPRTMNRRLRKMGTSYRDLLKQIKLDISKNLLVNTNYPISEISARMGYNDPSNFTKAFKQWTNMTPLEYRKSIKSEQRL